MKYIDAEKLIAFKEALADIIVSSQGLCTYDACKERAEQDTPILLATISSLQQEQTELNLEKEFNKALDNLETKDMRGWFRHFYELGARKEQPEEGLEGYKEASCENCVKVSGYIARSDDEDFLCWYSDKPVPSKEMPGCWLVPHPLTNWVKLPKEAWPDLKPEHGPIEVDLILKRI